MDLDESWTKIGEIIEASKDPIAIEALINVRGDVGHKNGVLFWLRNVVTTDHESKQEFIARVNAIINS